jgi:leader peptidase (prepilin peptidase)/N-methyltransferase
MMIVLIILLGWVAGWLVNYLADVLPVTRKFGRPACPHCHTPYRWADYLLLRRCASCGRRRGWRTLIIQAVLTLAPAILWVFPRSLPLPLGFLLFIYLALVFVVDIEHRLILHPVSWVGAVLGLGIGISMHGLVPTLIGGITGFGVMLIFYYVGEWYVKIMVKRRGMSSDEVALGFGDVNLSGILGLLLGWPNIVAGLLFGVVAGGFISLLIILGMLISKKYKAFTAIPYAPFLILSALLLYIK